MSDKPGSEELKREETLEQVEELLVMGYVKPYHIQKALGIVDWNQVKRYIAIAQRRLRHRFDNTVRYDDLMKKEMRSLALMERKAWGDYSRVGTTIANRAEIMRNIIKIKERRASMLGLDVTRANVNFNFNADQSKKPPVLSNDEVTALIKTVRRIDHELTSGIEQKPAEPAAPGTGATVAPALRPDVPVASPDQPGAAVPPGHPGAPAG